MSSFSNLDNLNAQIERKGAHVGTLLEHATNVYTKSIGEFIIATLETQYLATEVDNLISIYIQEASRLPSVTVPQYYTTYIYYIQDVIRKCKQLLSKPITNPELMLLVPEKMLERAQQTMYNLLPAAPYDYRHGEMGVPIEHYTTCSDSVYNNDYANLAIYAKKAADDIELIPNVLKSLNQQRDAENVARENSRLAAEIAQTEVLRQRIEEYRREQTRLATTLEAQRIIVERREHANLNNISRNPFGALGFQRQTLEEAQMEARDQAVQEAMRVAALSPSAQAAYQAETARAVVAVRAALAREAAEKIEKASHQARRAALVEKAGVTAEESKTDDKVYESEKKPYFVDEEFTKPTPVKVTILKKLIGRMNGTQPISDVQIEAGQTPETINITEEINKIVPELGTKAVTALQETLRLVETGNPQRDREIWSNHKKEIYKILTEDMIDKQDELSKDRDIYYTVPVECLMKAGRFLESTPSTPMGGQHKILRKQNLTKKQSKKHNITKHRKKI